MSDPNQNPSIIGEWKWVESKGSWGALYLPGYNKNVIFSFTSDTTYAVKVNNQVSYSGHCTTTVIPSASNLKVITFDTTIHADNLMLNKQESITFVKSDSLMLYDFNITDGIAHLFIKN